MSKAVNVVVIQGNITRDIELNVTSEKNVPYTFFSIAQDETYGEKKTTMFFDVKAWRSTAEFINNYFKKGQSIIIHGELKSAKYADAEGNSRTSVYLSANEVFFGDSKKVDKESAAPEE